jgi:hypothetical protein
VVQRVREVLGMGTVGRAATGGKEGAGPARHGHDEK